MIGAVLNVYLYVVGFALIPGVGLFFAQKRGRVLVAEVKAFRKAQKNPKAPNYLSSTRLTTQMDIARMNDTKIEADKQYGGHNPSLKVDVAVQTVLDSELKSIVRREATGITMTIGGIEVEESYRYSYDYDSDNKAYYKAKVHLTAEQCDELQTSLCLASVTKDGVY